MTGAAFTAVFVSAFVVVLAGREGKDQANVGVDDVPSLSTGLEDTREGALASSSSLHSPASAAAAPKPKPEVLELEAPKPKLVVLELEPPIPKLVVELEPPRPKLDVVVAGLDLEVAPKVEADVEPPKELPVPKLAPNANSVLFFSSGSSSLQWE